MSIRCEPRSSDRGLQLGLDLLQLRVDRDQVGDLLGGHPAAGLAGDVTGPDGGEHGLGLGGGQVAFALARQQFAEQALQPVDRLDPLAGELVAAVGEHPQRLELTVLDHHPQAFGADRDDGDGVGVQGVGLAVVAGVEEPHPRRELRRHIDHLLAGGDESLGQWTAGAVGSLDRPEAVGPLLHITAHRGVTGVGGVEPTAAEELFVGVDDLDRHRHLVGIDPDDHALRLAAHLLTSSSPGTSWTTRWALLLRAGQTPLEPLLVTVTDGSQSR